MTTPPGYAGSDLDTSGASGNPGSASRGTQDRASVAETSTPAGAGYGGGDDGLSPDENLQIDEGTFETSGTNGTNTDPWSPSTNYLDTTDETSMVNWPQTPGVDPAYRAPAHGIGYLGAAGSADTTWTDRPLSDGNPRSDYGQNVTETIESANIGSNGAAGLGTSSLVPAAPSGTPVAADGERSVSLTWSAVANPHSTAPVLGYVILGPTGGTTFVGRDVHTAVVTNLVPGQDYQFRVAARNKNGLGPYSSLSTVATPYNPDEPDVNKPGGLNAYWAQDPIYDPDGTIKAGSGLQGRPGAPTSVTLAGDGVVGHVVGSWTPPASGGRVLSYTLTLSSGQTKTVSNTTTTTTISGVSSATAITGIVRSNGAITNATSSASGAFGKPTAPAAPTLTSPVAGAVKVDWTAPSSGAPINYIITLSNGHTHTVAGNLLTYTFTGETTGATVTATVGAQGSVSTTTSAASSGVTIS